jgi:hypothetical protein
MRDLSRNVRDQLLAEVSIRKWDYQEYVLREGSVLPTHRPKPTEGVVF